MALVIEKMFAFVSVDAEGNEGVMGIQMADGTWMPLVGADMARVDSLRRVAIAVSERTGVPYRLVEFSNRIQHEEYSPQK